METFRPRAQLEKSVSKQGCIFIGAGWELRMLRNGSRASFRDWVANRNTLTRLALRGRYHYATSTLARPSRYSTRTFFHFSLIARVKKKAFPWCGCLLLEYTLVTAGPAVTGARFLVCGALGQIGRNSDTNLGSQRLRFCEAMIDFPICRVSLIQNIEVNRVRDVYANKRRLDGDS